MQTIEEIVLDNVDFPRGIVAQGWSSSYCEHCGDGKYTKGPRGGWRFEDDTCSFHCFNCGVTASFDPSRDNPYSKQMYSVFEAFSIPISTIKEFIFTYKKQNGDATIKQDRGVRLPFIRMGDYMKPLHEYPEDDIIAVTAREFMWDRYRMVDTDYPFYLSDGETISDDDEVVRLAKWTMTRITIPAYNSGKVMLWQSREFLKPDIPDKYITSKGDDGANASVVYGMDNMFNASMDTPLYITEGFFDSWHVNGVAVMNSTMTSSRIKVIDRSRRNKVIIPDINAGGMLLAEQGIELGWGISLPNILPEVDICAAIVKYGKLYTMKTIEQNTYHGFEAKLRLKDFMIKNSKFLT